MAVMYWYDPKNPSQVKVKPSPKIYAPKGGFVLGGGVSVSVSEEQLKPAKKKSRTLETVAAFTWGPPSHLSFGPPIPLDRTIDFSWDVLGGAGTEPMVFWWLVESQTVHLEDVYFSSGDPVLDAIAPEMYIQYLTAVSVEDLCKKLKDIFLARPLLYWRIKSIRKYLKPLRWTDDAALGEDTNPWISFAVENGWQTVPECMHFGLLAGQGAGPITKPGNTVNSSIFNAQSCYTDATSTADTIIPAVAPNISGGITASLLGFFKLTGSSPVVAPIFTYIPSGGFTFGGTYYTTPPMLAPDGELYLPEPIEWDAQETSITTNCECVNVAEIVFLYHEFEKFGKFGNFMKNNGFAIPEPINLVYLTDSKWQAMTHFHGNGLESGSKETWVIRNEWACSNAIENTTLADYTWQYTLNITRTQRWTNRIQQTTTKLQGIFLANHSKEINFYVTYFGDLGTMTDLVSGRSAISVIIEDGIGVFEGASWRTEPSLTIEIVTTPPPAEPLTMNLAYAIAQ